MRLARICVPAVAGRKCGRRCAGIEHIIDFGLRTAVSRNLVVVLVTTAHDSVVRATVVLIEEGIALILFQLVLRVVGVRHEFLATALGARLAVSEVFETSSCVLLMLHIDAPPLLTVSDLVVVGSGPCVGQHVAEQPALPLRLLLGHKLLPLVVEHSIHVVVLGLLLPEGASVSHQSSLAQVVLT